MYDAKMVSAEIISASVVCKEGPSILLTQCNTKTSVHWFEPVGKCKFALITMTSPNLLASISTTLFSLYA